MPRRLFLTKHKFPDSFEIQAKNKLLIILVSKQVSNLFLDGFSVSFPLMIPVLFDIRGAPLATPPQAFQEGYYFCRNACVCILTHSALSNELFLHLSFFFYLTKYIIYNLTRFFKTVNHPRFFFEIYILVFKFLKIKI